MFSKVAGELNASVLVAVSTEFMGSETRHIFKGSTERSKTEGWMRDCSILRSVFGNVSKASSWGVSQAVTTSLSGIDDEHVFVRSLGIVGGAVALPPPFRGRATPAARVLSAWGSGSAERAAADRL
jgi:hypothetical protein